MHLEAEELDLTPDEEELSLLTGERIEFKSVGIDIGSSTTHLMFSRLVLARRGREYISGYTTVKREVLYRSPVIFTPFLPGNSRVDVEKLKTFFTEEYEKAGLSPGEVDTGALITTGEAARKENTAALIQMLATEAGKFVCATAGPNLEAVLAAHGSGAVKHSLKHHHGNHETIMNVDIGGGTAKVAIIQESTIIDTCAINIGSRLFAWDDEGKLTRIEEAGRTIAAAIGLFPKEGSSLAEGDKNLLAEKMAEILFEVLTRKPLSNLASTLMITPPLNYHGPVDLTVFSGGVGEFVYERERGSFGDLGPYLGREIRKKGELLGFTLGFPEERLRATVIGASQYTVQVSGNTIFLSHPEILPLRNVPVVKLPPLPAPFDRSTIVETVRRGFARWDMQPGKDMAALAINWNQDPDYKRLSELASGIALSFSEHSGNEVPLILVFDNDVGKLVGHMLADLNLSPLVVLDNINVGSLNYIDIGRELSQAKAVPVTVKSLIFR